MFVAQPHRMSVPLVWRALTALLGIAGASLAGTTMADAATYVSATTITADATWTATASPYVINGDVSVSAGATLTLAPGTIVKFNGPFRTLRIHGALNSAGSADGRVTFTSIQDDSIGGDSGADGYTAGAPGQWYAIQIRPGSVASTVTYTDIRYGGYGSARWNYGAIDVADPGAITVSHSRITDNQTSAIKLYGIGASATVLRSELTRNGNGISANVASVTISDGTVIADNLEDGLWFNLPTVTNKPPRSLIAAADVTRNGRYGFTIQANGDYPLALLPTASGNNIYGNLHTSGKQVEISGYPSFKNAALSWSGNYWGDDVYYYSNPSQCAGATPNSSGRLAYRASTSAPPAGPMGSGSYTVYPPYPQPFVVCATAPAKVRDCGFSSSYISEGRATVAYEGAGVSASAAATCADETDAAVEAFATDFSTLGGDVSATFAPADGMTPTEIADAYAPTVASLFDEVNATGDFSFTYSGTAPVQRMRMKLAGPSTSSIAFPASPCFDPWWPTEGYVEVGPSNQPGFVGKRRIYQWFRWNAANLLYFKACRGNLTIEPDAVFDKSDGLTYLGTKTGAKLSNLPRHYDDTRVDEVVGDETSYTVGSADAQQLIAERKYFTLIRTNPGSASTDQMFVRFQNGVRIPAGCYSTWCVYSAAVGAEQVVLPKWQTVPGSFAWARP